MSVQPSGSRSQIGYRRYEINLRIALVFSAATAAGAFGGLLARLINFMHGVAGLEGWVSLRSA